MTLQEKLKRLDVVMVSHVFVTGAFLDFEEYLKTKTHSLFFIGHPFSFRKEINSFYRYYTKGKLIKEHKAIGWRLPDFFLYCKDAFYTFWWILISKHTFDIYFAADNFDAYIGLLLKKTGRVKEVVFYTIDYIPKRFKNPFLNFLYHYFDKQCLQNCKIVWNISPNMIAAREQFGGLKKEKYVTQLLVPQGIWHNRIPKISIEEKEKASIVFLGHLVERQGLDLVIEAMPLVRKKIPQATLHIIGTGDFEEKLKKLVLKLKLSDVVTFSGYIKDDKLIEEKLGYSTIAVAMYKPTPGSLTYFADPMKVKVYLSSGLPIVLTDVPPIAKDLAKKRCALLSLYKKEELAKNIILLLSNKKLLAEYRENAIAYASEFDYNKIFEKALTATLQ